MASRSELTIAVEGPRDPADALVWSFGGTHFLRTVASSKAVASLHPSKAEQLGAVQLQKENYRGTKGQKGAFETWPCASQVHLTTTTTITVVVVIIIIFYSWRVACATVCIWRSKNNGRN